MARSTQFGATRRSICHIVDLGPIFRSVANFSADSVIGYVKKVVFENILRKNVTLHLIECFD